MAMASSTTAPPTWGSRCVMGRGLGSGWGMNSSEGGFRRRNSDVMPVNNAEHHRDEEQRRNGGEDQAAAQRAAERGVLFAALTEAQRHRQHADHHRERRHQYRAQPHESGFEGGSRC